MERAVCQKVVENKEKERISRKETSILIELFVKGKLGVFPVADKRLKAGLLFIRDYGKSVFSQKTTQNYDRLFLVDSGKSGDFGDYRYDAADRYLRALNALGAYSVYARHFLRDEQNIRSFLKKYPVLNQGSKRTYRMVYLAINKMLDKLVCFYEKEQKM